MLKNAKMYCFPFLLVEFHGQMIFNKNYISVFHWSQKATYLNECLFHQVDQSAEKLNGKGENPTHFCFMNYDKSLFDRSLDKIHCKKDLIKIVAI